MVDAVLVVHCQLPGRDHVRQLPGRLQLPGLDFNNVNSYCIRWKSASPDDASVPTSFCLVDTPSTDFPCTLMRSSLERMPGFTGHSQPLAWTVWTFIMLSCRASASAEKTLAAISSAVRETNVRAGAEIVYCFSNIFYFFIPESMNMNKNKALLYSLLWICDLKADT